MSAADEAVFVNSLARGPVVLVTAVGAAGGSREAAAALACAASGIDEAALLVDVGGRPPRPTLLSSAAAQRLEERLRAHLPEERLAARGQLCQLSVRADLDGLAAASAAAAAVRGGTTVLHLPATQLQAALDVGPAASGALLRGDAADRALLALLVRDLLGRGLGVAVLKRRLGWVIERRALFGALPGDVQGGLPDRLRRRLLGKEAAGCELATSPVRP